MVNNSMFNFTPPHIAKIAEAIIVRGFAEIRICRNLVEVGIRNVTDGVHLLCMPSVCL